MADNTATSFLWLIIILGSLIILLAFGFGVMKLLKGKNSSPDHLDLDSDEIDDPTAPISPSVELSRSPHDRQRDMEAGQSIVDQIENLEMIIASSGGKSKGQIIEQLKLFRGEFSSLLSRCYFEEFSFEPGTVVDLDIRKKILVSEGDSTGDQTIIAETLLCGFAYRYEDMEPVIIRKAEVAIR